MKKKDIEIFLIDFFVKKDGKGVKKILYKSNLYDEGILDSLDIVSLSIEIEKKYNIKINPNSSETLNNLTNLTKTIDYIYSKIN